MDLSVIIPYAGEYPAAEFTLVSVLDELEGRDLDFEIIMVDNMCPELASQGFDDRRSREAIDAAAGLQPRVRSLAYDKRLSHWQAKNAGVRASSGEFLFFCDAHCSAPRGSIWSLYEYCRRADDPALGSVHLPLTYKLAEARKVVYKLIPEFERGFLGYSLTPLRIFDRPYEAPCASTCGMMVRREVFELMEGWPQKYAYSGGEHYWNFGLAVLGLKKMVIPFSFLRHHGAPSDYHYTYDGLIWNQCAAMFLIGGLEMARRYIDRRRGRPETLERIFQDVTASCGPRQRRFEARKKIDIQEWVKQW